QATGNQPRAAATWNALAAAYLSLGRYQAAIAASEASVALAQTLGLPALEAQALGNLGIAYQSSGRYAAAVATYQAALALTDAPGVTAAQLHGLLGNAYESLGDYPSAIAAQTTSLELATAMAAPALAVTAHINLGGLYSVQGDYATAIAWYEAGIALARHHQFWDSAAYGLNNLGGTYQQLGQPAAAIDQFQASLTLATQTGDRALQATVLTNLGVAQEDQGDWAAALESHRQSVAIARTLEDPRLLADALNNYAHTQLLAGQLTAAESALQESIQLLTTLRAGLADGDKVNVFDTQIYTYNLLMQVQVAQGDYEAALVTSEQGRARAFVETVAGEATLPPPDLAQMRRVAQTLNATLVEYAIVPAADFRVQGRQRGTAGQVYIWAIAPTGAVTFAEVDLTGVDLTLDEQVQQSRAALGALGRTRGLGVQAVTAPDPASQLAALYQQLIAPIEAALPTDPDELVVLVPHEALFYLPFAALQDAEGRYLIERHTLLTVPAIQLLELTLTAAPPVPQATPLVVGNPTMPPVLSLPPLTPLPGAEVEAVAIADILQTEAILGSAATEAHITAAMPQANVIHLATHGLLDYVDTRDRLPIPGAIALTPSATADGLLTAREIAALPLQAALVVLSACDTGLGEVTGDGVVGLSRSLIAAGAQSTVVSLWSVPDEATATLMQAFYTELQAGQNKAQALRQAMLHTQAQYPDPLAWAAFVLVGNPTPLPLL
ncbi:MAG TPA: CHAT domain-containing tetratricopeptide repeat protein, partial [Candidatus Obscuribacterales bacterium]